MAEAGYKVMAEPSEQVDKVIQLYEVLMTRHTTMVVGQTGGGKTVILNTLARAQSKLGKKTYTFTINPKVSVRGPGRARGTASCSWGSSVQSLSSASVKGCSSGGHEQAGTHD